MKLINPMRQVRAFISSLYLVIPVICSLFLMSSALTQTPGTGAISGTVYDPSARFVVGAEIEAMNEATHISRLVTTNAEGVFHVPLLPPGDYHRYDKSVWLFQITYCERSR